MAATLRDTANFDNNCVATPEMYRRGYNFRLSSLFLSKLASIAGENMGKDRLWGVKILPHLAAFFSSAMRKKASPPQKNPAI
jgi:hypothetical protein